MQRSWSQTKKYGSTRKNIRRSDKEIENGDRKLKEEERILRMSLLIIIIVYSVHIVLFLTPINIQYTLYISGLHEIDQV